MIPIPIELSLKYNMGYENNSKCHSFLINFVLQFHYRDMYKNQWGKVPHNLHKICCYRHIDSHMYLLLDMFLGSEGINVNVI